MGSFKSVARPKITDKWKAFADENTMKQPQIAEKHVTESNCVLITINLVPLRRCHAPLLVLRDWPTSGITRTGFAADTLA